MRDIEPGVYIGWKISLEDFHSLCEKREDVTRLEDRFDPKTGEPTEPEVVTIEEGGFYFNNRLVEHDEFICGEIQEYINEKLGEDTLAVTPLQDQWGAMQGIIIGKDIDRMTAGDAGRTLTKSEVIFARKRFRVEGLPKILCFLYINS